MSEATDKIDRFGHCICCGENLLTKRVVDGRVVDMFKPTYDHTFFLLDNGSQMQVTICKMCKESTDLSNPKIQEEIMEACLKGWELEQRLLVEDERFPEWTAVEAEKYMKEKAFLNIDCHSENLDKNIIRNRQIELLNLPKDSEVENVSN